MAGPGHAVFGGSTKLVWEVRYAQSVEIAVPGDFDGDGATDILWYGHGDDPDSVWFATSGDRFKSTPITVSGNYAPI